MEEQKIEEMKIKQSESEERAKKETKRRWTITGSMLAKVIAFFLLAVSFFVGGSALVGSAYFWNYDVYDRGIVEVVHSRMVSSIWSDVGYLKGHCLYQEYDQMEKYLNGTNLMVDIYDGDTLLWGNYDGREVPEFLSFLCYSDTFLFADEENIEETVVDEDNIEETIVGEDNIEKTVINEEKDNEASDEAYDEAGEVVAEDDGENVKLSASDEFTGKLTPEEAPPTAMTMEEEEGRKVRETQLTFYVYVDPELPMNDIYRDIYMDWMRVDPYIEIFPWMAVGGCFLFLCCFIFLMCSAGHHGKEEGITGGVLSKFSFDIVTLLFGFVAALGILCLDMFWGAGAWTECIAVALVFTAEAVWITIYFMEFAIQLKMGTLFKNTLVWKIMSLIGKGFRFIGRSIKRAFQNLPLVLNIMIWYGAFCIIELIGLFFFFWLWGMRDGGEVLSLWLIEKTFLMVAVLIVAQMWKKLQKGSEALADGNLNYQLDTTLLAGEFKEHGENLNRIKEGIALAVDERMKSEHLKTELITNVSHDLKTPLTSIINYADLLGNIVSDETVSGSKDVLPVDIQGVSNADQQLDRAQIAEYAEVLLRQSKRLKKLLDDLMEASKATTGNLEVNLMPCEVSVILSQAVGEYEQRFEQKELELIVRQPEEPVKIQADGRHLWRVFDNLMNNICKYAQENTRVYLTVERTEKEAQIVFRNMSKYPLELSAEELKERFTRGDRSRHMEGNGLGLSIAGSLVELQNGKMDVVTDGDLFKVVLSFPILA